MLDVGMQAPEFNLENQNGEKVSLSQFLGQRVLIWFYPKASTPGWIVEGQGLRDEFEKFQKKNTIILGVSADSVKAQKNFCVKQDFLFSLLSDPDKSMIRAYKAIGLKKMYGREYEGIFRVSYLLDEKGKVLKAYEKVKPKEHANEVLSDLS
jgi:peroxiredoxin Q/BCP